ncbi:MAG TPA: isoamylase early set domain-containing protein [Puia sp.]|nr:isoamylase early set domain-containing protein [Puia sp.]
MKLQHQSPYLNKRKKTIEFHIELGAAQHISLAGTFNHWAKDELEMKCEKDGSWKIEIPMLPRGKYHYKFLIDDKMWMEDIENQLREPDGVTGWNSVLTV